MKGKRTIDLAVIDLHPIGSVLSHAVVGFLVTTSGELSGMVVSDEST